MQDGGYKLYIAMFMVVIVHTVVQLHRRPAVDPDVIRDGTVCNGYLDGWYSSRGVRCRRAHFVLQ
jgi:hypothetical protein